VNALSLPGVRVKKGNEKQRGKGLGKVFLCYLWIPAFTGMTQEKQDFPISLAYVKGTVGQQG